MKSGIRITIYIACVYVLAACGGGGSSSAGAGGAGNPFTGVYNGSLTFTLSGTGFPTVSEVNSVTVEIRGNGAVIVTFTDSDGEVFQGQGTLAGNSFSVTDADQFSESGITCSGNITIAGTLTGDAVSGPVTGNVTCNGLPLQVSGSLRATRSATASLVLEAAPSSNGMFRMFGKRLSF